MKQKRSFRVSDGVRWRIEHQLRGYQRVGKYESTFFGDDHSRFSVHQLLLLFDVSGGLPERVRSERLSGDNCCDRG